MFKVRLSYLISFSWCEKDESIRTLLLPYHNPSLADPLSINWRKSFHEVMTFFMKFHEMNVHKKIMKIFHEKFNENFNESS
jgi:hypothetical protein